MTEDTSGFDQVYVGMTVEELKTLIDTYRAEDEEVTTEIIEEIRGDLNNISSDLQGVFNILALIFVVIILVFLWRTFHGFFSGIFKG
jgi:uncharacterized membrane protein (DUF106 family)